MIDNEKQLARYSSDFIEELLTLREVISDKKKSSKITQDDFETEVNAIFSSYLRNLATAMTDEQQDENYELFRNLELDRRELVSLGFDPGDEAFNSRLTDIINRTVAHSSPY